MLLVSFFMVKRYLIFSISSTDFAFFFQIFFLRLRLTTRLESRKKAYKKEKFFYKKSLTT